MKKSLAAIVALLLCAIGFSAEANSLNGAWRGEISVGQFRIPLVFNFTETSPDSVGCTIDSPSQGAKGIPATVTRCSGDSITVECRMIGATYTAGVTTDSICGTFTQRGIKLPLILRPEEALSARRPQTPAAPFPYFTTDTTFVSADGTRLAATLTIPATTSSSRIPAVVMVSGSGPQNRDEELFDHKPFAVIADFLARKGIASLRYDDRGTGASTGDFSRATIKDFKEDARSGVEFLRAKPVFDRIGVLGHSEGGTIALMLASKEVPDFIISLAGMAVSGKETLLRQNIRGLDRAGITGEARSNSLRLLERVFDLLIEQNLAGVRQEIDIDSLARAMNLSVPAPVAASLKSAQKTRNPEVESLLTLDPSQFMSGIACPVLAINGDRDTQVDAASNIGAINRSIPQADTRIMPGLNHLMQHCVTGEVSEYGEIRETISPEVLEAIAGFIISGQ